MTTEEKIAFIAKLAGKHEITIYVGKDGARVELGYVTSDTGRWVAFHTLGMGPTLGEAIGAALAHYVRDAEASAALLVASLETHRQTIDDLRSTAAKIRSVL